MKSKAITIHDDPDWLGLALSRMGDGDIAVAARRLGVPRRAVVGWFEHGLGAAPFATVLEIARLGDVPLALLARRLGPWREPGNAAPQKPKAAA
jgi:hypothetical protein